MKRDFTNKFKDKINEIEYEPTQADWKSFSSALDKSMPFDSGLSGSLNGSVSAAGTAATSFSWFGLISKLFLVAIVGAGVVYSLSSNDRASSNASDNLIANTVINQKNSLEEIKITNADQVTNDIENKSTQQKNISEIKVNNNFVKGSIQDEKNLTTINNTNISKSPANKFYNGNSKTEILDFGKISKDKLEDSILNNDITPNKSSNSTFEPYDLSIPLKDKIDAAQSNEQKNKNNTTDLFNSNDVGAGILNNNESLNFLPSIQFTMEDDGIENLLNEYSSSLLLSPEANLDLVFDFENIRIQAMYLGSKDYSGFEATIMEPLKGKKFCDFFVGIGLGYYDFNNYYPFNHNAVYGRYHETIEPKIFVSNEFSISLIAEAKKAIWKDKVSAYLTLKPELVVARTGRIVQFDEVNFVTYHNPLQLIDAGITKELMFSAGFGFDYSFNEKFEARIGYNYGFVETIKDSQTFDNTAINRGHINIGLNYSFLQKIKD